MDDRMLKFINLIALPAVFLIMVFMWFYLRDQFSWGIVLTVLILVVVLLMNVWKRVKQFVEERRNVTNKPYDVKAARRMNLINDVAIISAMAILAFSWLYLREQFAWGMILAILILFAAGFANVSKALADMA